MDLARLYKTKTPEVYKKHFLELIPKYMWEQTLDFLASPYRNKWLYSPDQFFKIYVRKGNRIYKNSVLKTLDIASVELDENFRGLGCFTKYLQFVEAEIKLSVYVENVLNQRLREFFLKREGWEELDLGYDRCFIMRKSV